ncbi:MAG: hypothetical protein COB36_01725 [Alphaproteobacteria bacterium]|nr:MAG: hypothetical protein COB36_01725 [Alphaproteobacteria bacterium]
MVMKIIKSVFKRGGRVLIGGLSILFAMMFLLPMLLVQGYAWLHSDSAQGFVRSYIEQQAKAQGYRLEMSDFDYNLEEDNISVARLDLYDATGLLLRMKMVSLDLDIRALLVGDVDADLSVRDIIFYNEQEISTSYSISHVRAHVDATLDDIIVGAFDVKALYRGESISTRSKFSLDDELLRLSDVAISAPDLRGAGIANVHLSNNLARGTFSGQLDKLSFYKHIIGAGHELNTAKFDITLAVAHGKQNASVRAKMRSYANKNFLIAVRDIDLDMHLSGSTLRVNSLKARDLEDGTFEVSGDVDLASEAVDLFLKAKHFHAPKGGIADGFINVDLDFKGDKTAYILNGNISPEKINITLPERFTQAIPEINVETPKTRATDTQNMGQNITLDIVVDAPNQIFVRGWGLDAEFGGKVKIHGALADPQFDGVLKLQRGRYDEFGKSFNVAKATLNFSGSIPPNPIFDILVETKTGDIMARVGITGNALKPSIKFSSDPALPEDEVLAHILFGEGMGNISPFQAVQLTQTLQRFTGHGSNGGGFDPVGLLRTTTGLDDLRFDADEDGNASVGAGKHLSDKVYLEVEAGSADGSGSANIEIELTPNITLESEIGQDARGGAGIFWNWDY